MYFNITTQQAKMRLDKFLKAQFSDLSRARLQKLIEAGSVTVNGQRVPAHYFLRVRDEVEATVELVKKLRVVANAGVRIVPSPQSSPTGGEEGDRNPSPLMGEGRGEGATIQVLYEEPDFIVVNKPAGLVVHQGEGHKAPDTLVNGLLARYPEIARVGDDLTRPGIVHRLDGDVSGVMVIARTQDMFDHLKRQFKLHEVEKEYVAVVQGKVTPPEGVIEFPIARKGARMVARPKPSPQPSPLGRGRKGEGKRAVTEYAVLKEIKRLSDEAIKKNQHKTQSLSRSIAQSLLQIRTRTGRTHQIRVHLKAIGHAIVGDRLYGVERRAKSKEKEPYALCPKLSAGALRLMLHARKLGFKDLKGEWREFEAQIPSEFVRY